MKHTISKANKFKRIWVSYDELQIVKLFRDELGMRKAAYGFAKMAVCIAVGAAMLKPSVATKKHITKKHR